MRMLAVLLAALVLVSVASAARTATVIVRDASLAPARVRVDAGGSVTWRNAGARSHRIASGTGAFAAFTLAPRARKTVRFTRNGAHRYTVDGSRCGIVYVGVALGPGCSGGGTAPPPPQGTKIYAYNVVFRGSLKNEGYVDDSDGRRYQTWVHDFSWTSTTTNFKFKVISYNGTNFIGVNAAGRAVAASARVTQKWVYFWHPHSAFPPNADCAGEVSGTARSNLAVAVGHPTKPNYYVLSQLPDGWNKVPEIQADCNTWSPPTPETKDFRTADGSLVSIDHGTLTIDFHRDSGGLRNPAGALANGRSFTVDSGVNVSEKSTCEGACSGTLKMTERYIATFTRRP